ncbi:hypothetical protein [Sulfidibacter corallicola]|uniref:Uncharacterized protein n=1 Tax=Sulfidibacter corallicola TaxID=2818388 RepID=A0A8A4TR48_SULCO|nr:hypothetical protein [Sulfidibacter corallicola]QTD51877.1 hypothetical protein J3U87_05345 [Sulfidibacter corallicola]
MKKNLMLALLMALMTCGFAMASQPPYREDLTLKEYLTQIDYLETSYDDQTRFKGDACDFDDWDMDTVTDCITDSLEDYLLGEIGSFLKELIFGSDGPSYVNLTQESLDKIQAIMNQELVNMVKYDMIADLASLETGIKQYHASLNSTPDTILLALIDTEARNLVNHQVFNTSYHPDAKMLTGHLAFATSLRLAILVEKEHLGLTTEAFVRSEGQNLADKLSALGSAADSHINSRVYLQHTGGSTIGCQIYKNADAEPETVAGILDVQEKWGNCPRALVYDLFGGRTKVYQYTVYGQLYYRLALNYRDQLRTEYRANVKGPNYDSILADLRGL